MGNVPPQLEMNRNAYLEQESDLVAKHCGKTVLYHNGQVVEIYEDRDEAYESGCKRFGLGNFSIVKVGQKPISLGVFALNLPN